MEFRASRQGLIWSAVLILVGVLLLVGQFTELSAWVWVALLAAAGLGAFGLYLTDRTDWGMLLATYVLWAIAVLVALVTLEILQDEAVAFYVLLVIALPFFAVYLRDRALWWALIPAYVLLAIAVMVGLIGLGLLEDELVASYVLLAIALPFFVVYVRNRTYWWALIPGGILAVIGLVFLIAQAAFAYIGALVLIVVGAGLLVRVFARRESASEAGEPEPHVPPPTGTEAEEPGSERKG
jgi:hypothetical protein